MNKTVLISGSTSGIGLGIATSFAQAGYNIVFNGLEKEGVEIANHFATKYNTKTFYHPANMLKSLDIKDMINECEQIFGGVDILICNAGVQYVSSIDEFPEDKWNEILAVNLTASFLLSKSVWEKMKANKWGRIINISSAHGMVGSTNKSAYVASKHGVIGLTKVLALEGAAHGITVNAICPGYVKTPLVEKQIIDQIIAHNSNEEEVISNIILEKHAIKKFVDVDCIGELALFLASDKADMITGTSIPIDGGWTCQ